MTRRRNRINDEVELRRLAELAELGVATGALLHEIRQPLFVAKGLLELARAEGRSPDPTELAQALEELRHLQALVDHYGNLGRDDDEVVEVDALELALRTLATVGYRARRLGAELSIEGEPVVVRVRPIALRQVLLNLIGNALDAIAQRPERRITVQVSRDGADAVLRVADTGPGVALPVTETLFDAFVTTKPAGRGTGLGLWIARSLAEEAGGTIQVSKTGPEGAQIEVRLPVVVSGEGTGGSASSS